MNEYTPEYYKIGNHDVIDEFCDKNGAVHTMYACFMNIDKYLQRAGKKQGNAEWQDIEKAKVYLDRAENLYLEELTANSDVIKELLNYRKTVKAAENNLFRWHNVIDHPEDIPSEEEDVLIVIRAPEEERWDEPYSYYTGYVISGQWWCYMNHDCHRVGVPNEDEYDNHTGDKVIAWKRIEGYK